ncbi:hypothetical protein L1887_01334 [Cichorium endivia]|nr:hypothetical protein L1887_01334 [Cichorium endivia]
MIFQAPRFGLARRLAVTQDTHTTSPSNQSSSLSFQYCVPTASFFNSEVLGELIEDDGCDDDSDSDRKKKKKGYITRVLRKNWRSSFYGLIIWLSCGLRGIMLHGFCKENPLAPLIGRLGLPLYRTSGDNSVLYDHELESFEFFYLSYSFSSGEGEESNLSKSMKHLASKASIFQCKLNSKTPFVGTEQILLGLIGEGSGIAAKVQKSMGINLKDAKVEVEKIIGRGSGFVAVEIPLTPRVKHVLELSLEVECQLGHNYIGSELLLLGLLREGEGVAARVLQNLGADPNNICTQVIRMVDESAEGVGAGVGGGSSNNKMPTLEEYRVHIKKRDRKTQEDIYEERTKLVSAVLSLPVPSKSIYPSGNQLSNTLSQSILVYFDRNAPHKLLLIGCCGSGTSTIFKQPRILYKEIPFTDEERESIKFIIQSNVYGYLGILLEGRERFEDEALNEMKKNDNSGTLFFSYTLKMYYSTNREFSFWFLFINLHKMRKLSTRYARG